MTVELKFTGRRMRVTRDGFQAFERYQIIDESPAPADVLVYAAYQRGELPKVDSPHPSIPGIIAKAFDLTSDDPKFVEVEIEYGPPAASESGGTGTGGTGTTGGLRVSLSSSTIIERTVLDRDGNVMRVSYTDPRLSVPVTFTRTIQAEVARSTFSVNITKEFPAIPKNLIQDGQLGAINSIPWAGFRDKVFLFDAMTTQDRENGGTDVTMTFKFNKKTWRTQLVANIKGVIPDNVTIENGINFFDNYEEFDFATLGVTW